MAKEEKKNKNEKKVKKDNKHFFREFKAELKKVIWPTSKQLVNNTIAVITIVVITAVVVAVLDLAFGLLNTYGIDKIKTKVESNKIETSQEDANNITNETTEQQLDNTTEGEAVAQ